jgi:hypothetical protein
MTVSNQIMRRSSVQNSLQYFVPFSVLGSDTQRPDSVYSQRLYCIPYAQLVDEEKHEICSELIILSLEKLTLDEGLGLRHSSQP